MGIIFLLAPIGVVFVFAFSISPFADFPPERLSLIWFRELFASDNLMRALSISLWIAACTTMLSVLIGASAALALARGNLPGAQFLTTLAMSPLILPAILVGLGLFQTFALLGIGRPVWGPIIGHTLIATPYVIRTTLAVLENFDIHLEDAARSLGASPLQAFLEITLPLIKPGVAAGGIFAFIVSFDQFPISLFLAAPGTETFPIALYNHLRFALDGTIAAASVISILLACAAVLVLDRTVGLEHRGKL